MVPRARTPSEARMTMKICRLVLLLAWLLSSSTDFVKGRRLQLMPFFMLLSHVAIVYRIGGALSFTSGTSLPTRRSTRADVLYYRNISQMGGHYYDT